MVLTLLLGLTFLLTQVIEYHRIGFNTSDTAFAATFFGLTGLHGCHVFIGLMILLAMTIRSFRGHFTPGAPSRARDRRHLLALRRRDVDRGLRHRLHPLAQSCRAALRRPIWACRGLDPSDSVNEHEVCAIHSAAKRTAFRFVWLTIGYFALIVIGRLINSWVGVAGLRGRVGCRGLVVLRGTARARADRTAGPCASPAGERRILVIANETVGGRRAAERDPQPRERHARRAARRHAGVEHAR